MAMKAALVVAKERPSLDSRFAWTSTLKDCSTLNTSAIVYHNSNDTEEEAIGYLAQIYKSDPSKRFVYVNNEVSPLMSTFIYGIKGIVCDDIYPLSSEDLLISIIEEYDKSDFIAKPPSDLFSELQQAMSRILTGTLDEEELHDILTNPDWLSQVRSSMSTVSTSLVRVDKTSTQLATYVNHTREMLQNMHLKYEEVQSELKRALQAQEAQAQVSASSPERNMIMSYPAVPVPATAEKVLYIKELSYCPYLVSFLFAYQRHFMTQVGGEVKFLVIQPKTKQNTMHYADNKDIYLLHTPSLSTPTDKKAFLTFEPKLNVFNYFFDSPRTKLFIVLDRFQGDMLLRGAKMKTMYSVGNMSMIVKRQLSPEKVFCAVSGPKGSFVLPFIPGYSEKPTPASRIGCYSTNCGELFEKIDKMFGFESLG